MAMLLLVLLTAPLPSLAFSTRSSHCTWTPHGSPYPLHALANGVCPLESSLSPWSHPPSCPPPSDNPDPDPCLYTYPTFRANTGLSLITSPDIAASLAPALDDTCVPEWVRRHVTSPQVDMSPDERDTKRGWTVLPLPGRGLGIVATRAWKKGERVMVEAPVMMVRGDFLNPMAADGRGFGARVQEEMLERAVGALPRDTQLRLAGLFTRIQGHRTVGALMRDVVETNAFHLEVEGVDHVVVYKWMGRMNHGCRPNVFWRFDWKHLTMEVIALKDIKPGEEMVYSYTFLGYTHAERQAMLAHWGITECSCTMCTAGPSEIRLSDQRRERLFELHATLSAVVENPESLPRKRIDELVAETKQTVDEEELDAQMVEYYQVFARVYLALGDRRKAKENIELAEQKWVWYEGTEHSNIEGIKVLRKELEELEEEEEDEEYDEEW